MVRGLALRSLCSLRLPAMVEYISDPLKASLVDANSYVRKTGVMAILKMWHLWPQAVEDGAMVDTLYNMLQDSDAQVCDRVCVVPCRVEHGLRLSGLSLLRERRSAQLCAALVLLGDYGQAAQAVRHASPPPAPRHTYGNTYCSRPG